MTTDLIVRVNVRTTTATATLSITLGCHTVCVEECSVTLTRSTEMSIGFVTCFSFSQGLSLGGGTELASSLCKRSLREEWSPPLPF